MTDQGGSAYLRTICQIQCKSCGTWFGSPKQFLSASGFFGCVDFIKKARCPQCKAEVVCERGNMRFGERQPDGQMKYIDG